MKKKKSKQRRKYKSVKAKSNLLILEWNKHHILYPRVAWERIGPLGVFLRDNFVVTMRYDQHKQLHRKVDRTLGGYVWSDKLPKKSTLRYLEKELVRNYRKVSHMDAIRKIEWLMDRLSYDDAHSYWLKTMLRRQRDFLLDAAKEA